MRKFWIFIALQWVGLVGVYAQTDLTFHHMRAITPQSSMNNASFFPDAEFYFSFPAVSGGSLHFNNGFTYNHLMTPIENTDSVQVDFEKVLANLESGDNLRFRGDVSLFQVGVRAGNKTFSAFSNVRYHGGLTYPVNFLNYFVYGNGNFIGELVEENDISGGGIAYSEMGLGYSQKFLVGEDRNLTVGARVKLLHGIAFMESAENATINLFTTPDNYDINVQFDNASFQTAGINELQGDNLTGYVIGFGNNRNTGMAFDIGAEMEVNEKLTGYLSFNDFGFINWKQDIENYTLTADEIVLGGFDNIDDVDLDQALEDSLDVWSERSTDSAVFRTSVAGRILLSADYKLLKNGKVSGTLAWNGSPYGKSFMGYGIGYTYQLGKTLTLSSTVIKNQTKSVQVGAGFMFRLGLLQLYGVMDNLKAAFSPADAQGLGVRVGLNFMLGRHDTGKNAIRKPKKKKEKLSPFPPEYNLDYLNDDGGDEGGNMN